MESFGLLLLLFSKTKRMNYVIFGLAWFIFFLVPALAISFLKHEYRLYLPIIGIAILILETDFVKNIAKKPLIAALVCFFIAGLFSAITFFHSENFRNRIIFWRSAVLTSPHSPLAHRNLGAMHHLDGRLAEAETEYKKAIKLNPREQMVHNNLGLIYSQRKMFKKAEAYYKMEIAINPDYDNVYFNLALLYYHNGRKSQAAALWEKALELNPKNIVACKNLAAYYFNQKDIEKAAYYVKQLKIRGVAIPQPLVSKFNK